ncbi:unnamed protein product [Rangifer tarandus platyrhynchus]|uniref:Uncharacterized protein n=2 Tax=Rangifer tarandus platyrhynchus TaxID=3082113 RepID=A0ACB0FGT9_RANTA|nr:unnamed protein product [Rangifer tarandus platyrhynchus]CAI9711231.1 unnamed protein product [Rangifer tarandus platyrhynchus]
MLNRGRFPSHKLLLYLSAGCWWGWEQDELIYCLGKTKPNRDFPLSSCGCTGGFRKLSCERPCTLLQSSAQRSRASLYVCFPDVSASVCGPFYPSSRGREPRGAALV